MSRGGPKAPVKPSVLVAFLDSWSEYRVSGHPRRNRLYINGTPITDHDARMIRRWRSGTIAGVTLKTTRTLLDRYSLTYDMLVTYGEQLDRPNN